MQTAKRLVVNGNLLQPWLCARAAASSATASAAGTPRCTRIDIRVDAATHPVLTLLPEGLPRTAFQTAAQAPRRVAATGLTEGRLPSDSATEAAAALTTSWGM